MLTNRHTITQYAHIYKLTTYTHTHTVLNTNSLYLSLLYPFLPPPLSSFLSPPPPLSFLASLPPTHLSHTQTHTTLEHVTITFSICRSNTIFPGNPEANTGDEFRYSLGYRLAFPPDVELASEHNYSVFWVQCDATSDTAMPIRDEFQ